MVRRGDGHAAAGGEPFIVPQCLRGVVRARDEVAGQRGRSDDGHAGSLAEQGDAVGSVTDQHRPAEPVRLVGSMYPFSGTLLYRPTTLTSGPVSVQ